jgi:hypothetical protein
MVWNIIPCSPARVSRRSGATCCLRPHGRRISQSRNQYEAEMGVACFKLVTCLVYSSTMKMEAICSSDTSVDCHLTTRCYTAGDRIDRNHRCEKLKFYTGNWGFCCSVVLTRGRTPQQPPVRAGEGLSLHNITMHKRPWRTKELNY